MACPSSSDVPRTAAFFVVLILFTTFVGQADASCVDTDSGALDSWEDSCSAYTTAPSDCGSYNDADFTSETMCCACGGGETIPDVCGNNVTQPTNSETCDDGNTDSSDGCSGQCTVESGFSCSSSEPSECHQLRCGNSITQPTNSETCDDGNTDSGDGCSGQCTVESGFSCSSSEPSVCNLTHHLSVSGKLQPELNGCWEPRTVHINGHESWRKGGFFMYWSKGCSLGGRWIMEKEPEKQEDINTEDCVYHSSIDSADAIAMPPTSGGQWTSTDAGGAAQLNPGVLITAMPNPPVCGDGLHACGGDISGHTCDDNNTISGDGCSSQCTVEVGFGCVTASEPSLCRPPTTIHADSLSNFTGSCGWTSETACSSFAFLATVQLLPGDIIELRRRGMAWPYKLATAFSITASNVSFRSTGAGAAADPLSGGGSGGGGAAAEHLAVLDGGGSSPCLVLNGASDVTVQNLGFQNCRSVRGAGAYIKGGSKRVRFLGCAFLENEADYGGATDTCDGSSVSFVGCQFRNNRAINKGGVADVHTHSNVSFEDCNMTNNTAGFHGGVASLKQSSAFFLRSSLSFNSAKTSGGAVDASDNSLLEMHDSIVNSNVVSGVFSKGGAVSLSSASWANIRDTIFDGNQALGQGSAGGCLHAQDTGPEEDKVVSVRGGSMINNRVPFGSGGALSCELCFASFDGFTLKSNTAGLQGGHISASSLSSVIITNTSAQNGVAGLGGGCIFSNAARVTMQVSDHIFHCGSTFGLAHLGSHIAPISWSSICDSDYCLASTKRCAGNTYSRSHTVGCYRASPGYFAVGGEVTNAQDRGERCPAGSHAAADGATECSVCLAGFFSIGTTTTAAAVNCTACGLGSFASTTGASHCASCPAGFFSDKPAAAVCGRCGPGTHNCAVCAAGSHSPGGPAACEACPKGGPGSFCYKGSLSLARENYWHAEPVTPNTSFYACLASAGCRVCDQDADTCVVGVHNTTVFCAEGHTGPKCANCGPEFGKLNGRCQACIESEHTPLLVLAIVILGGGFLAMMRHTSKDPEGQLGMGVTIALDHVQMLAVLSSSGLQRSSCVAKMLGMASQADGGFDVLVSSTCLSKGYFDTLSISLASPLFMIAFLWAGVSAKHALLRWKKKRGMNIIQDYMHSAVLVAMLCNAPIAKLVWGFFACEEIDGVRYLASDYTVSCDSPQWSDWLPLASFAAVCTFAVPIALLATIYFGTLVPSDQNHIGNFGTPEEAAQEAATLRAQMYMNVKLGSIPPRLRYGTWRYNVLGQVYAPFKKWSIIRYSWPIVRQLRTILLVFIGAFMRHDKAQQLHLTVVVLVTCMFFLQKAQPYKAGFRQYSMIESLSIAGLFLVVLFGATGIDRLECTSLTHGVEIVIIAVNAVAVLAAAMSVFIAAYEKSRGTAPIHMLYKHNVDALRAKVLAVAKLYVAARLRASVDIEVLVMQEFPNDAHSPDLASVASPPVKRPVET